VRKTTLGHQLLVLTIAATLSVEAGATEPELDFSAPLKVQTCELMLSASLDPFKRPSYLTALRDAIYRLEGDLPKEDATSYDDIGFIGLADKLSVAKNSAIRRRLQGIEADLTSGNPERQIAALEIRGDDIQRALDQIVANESDLRVIYRAQRDQIFSWRDRVWNQLLSSSVVGSIILSTRLLWSMHLYPEGIDASHFFPSLILMTYAVKIIKAKLKYSWRRYDLEYYLRKDFLRRFTATGDNNQFLISSSEIVLPAEFQQMLLDNREDEQARALAVRLWGGKWAYHIRARWQAAFGSSLARTVANAGDLRRDVFLDQIAFRDDKTNEPIWLFFYRGFRHRPTPRKPPKDRAIRLQTEPKPLPGSVTQ
jgi:hypothetical protein